MADDAPGADQTAAGASAAGTDQTPQLSLRTQYTKDLSFENPRAPHSISPSQEAPNGDVQIKVSSQDLGDDLHEVMLEFQITASRGDDVVFIVELAYGGVFAVRGFDAQTQPLALWVECPRLLFPFARRARRRLRATHARADRLSPHVPAASCRGRGGNRSRASLNWLAYLFGHLWWPALNRRASQSYGVKGGRTVGGPPLVPIRLAQAGGS